MAARGCAAIIADRPGRGDPRYNTEWDEPQGCYARGGRLIGSRVYSVDFGKLAGYQYIYMINLYTCYMYRVSVYNGGRPRAKKNKTKLSISAREYVFANGIISIPRTLLYAIAYTKRFSTIMNHYFRRRCLFFFFSNLCTPRISFFI